MRPLSLKVKAFTSFRDEQSIDFSDLDLFVLWGPTGSGKSSLLDAITYALYGYVERVGREAAQLVSQGQPRMAVTLDFAVGDAVYRVSRSTTATGQSKVLLERREGAEWASYGEGADSVTQVKSIICELVGLDYDAFTRSVILPQGKFAEFLTGDATKRREILTELLGLELFQRMARRSREIATTAKVQSDTKAELLESEYAGANKEAVATVKENLKTNEAMLAAAEKLEKKLDVVALEHAEARRAEKAVRTCATEAQTLAASFSSTAFELDDHARAAKEAAAAVAARTAEVATTDAAAKKAKKARELYEKKTGTLETLIALGAKADALEIARTDFSRAQSSVDKERTAAEQADKQVQTVRAALTKADAALETTVEGLDAARIAHEESQHADRVGALVMDLKAGDPCPVCDRPLKTVPGYDRKAMDKSATALEKARDAHSQKEKAFRDAETKLALAEERLQAAIAGVARCERERKEKQDLIESHLAALSKAIPRSTKDPKALIDDQIESLRELIEDESATRDDHSKAEQELARAEIVAERSRSRVAELRARLIGAGTGGLFDRATAAAPGLELPDRLGDDLPEDADALATTAGSFAKELEKLADDLTDLARSHQKTQAALMKKAQEALPDGVRVTDDLGSLVAQARNMTLQQTAEVTAARAAVENLQLRMEARKKLEAEIDTQRSQHKIYAALGNELKSDRIVQFLQAEALEALSVAASRHLLDLSSTRFRLAYEQDRFYVIDAWNGDERRNVKTLSGGET
ncbi:MAG: repair protein SbcC/Rad50, partial [Actinomycetota bacterium]|nr:repair protein SbcC/Rad50 [Actinomycetota bacterium]